MRLIVGSLMTLLAPLALAGGAYLKQDITGHWHYPELFPLDARTETADEDSAAPPDGTAPAITATRPTTTTSGHKRERTAQHP